MASYVNRDGEVVTITKDGDGWNVSFGSHEKRYGSDQIADIYIDANLRGMDADLMKGDGFPPNPNNELPGYNEDLKNNSGEAAPPAPEIAPEAPAAPPPAPAPASTNSPKSGESSIVHDWHPDTDPGGHLAGGSDGPEKGDSQIA